MSVVDHPLHSLPKYGDGIGLHRVKFLMAACGLDAADIARRAVAVTGSNGKGSTACIAAALLQTEGTPVGLFTSPHLYRYNERFRFDGAPVDDARLMAAMDRVAEAVNAYAARHGDAVGAFEAQFVVALELFRDCRWLVLEAGIGGRYDPVRLAQAPVTALVSLDLEHTELLGRTLLEIALDKLDATAPGGTAVLGESCLRFREQIETYANLRGIAVRFLDPGDWHDLGIADGVQHFDIRDGDFDWQDLRSPLVGRHQINNHAVALALVQERLTRAGLWPVADVETRWRDAIAGIAWPGRLEIIALAPLVVIDVGHTPEGIRLALDGFRALAGKRRSLLVTGGSKNKHVEEMLAVLAPRFDRILCTAAHHNGRPAPEIAAIVRAINPQAVVSTAPTIADAVARVRSDTAPSDAVYVAGGLFLAAEFAHAWRGGDAVGLKFF